MKKNVKGFTLIEILIVVALIAILAAVTIIALNPAKNFADTRNAQRSSDVSALLNAITQYTTSENTDLAGMGITTACDVDTDGAGPDTEVLTVGHVLGTDAANLNLTPQLITNGRLIVAIPKDPRNGTDANTGYVVCVTASGRTQVQAPNAENNKRIVVQR